MEENKAKLYAKLWNRPDGVFWKETDYHKQKELEKKNIIFKKGGRR